MASEHILRIPRSDSEGDFVLVNVTSNGSSPLDLKLLATEGESPYVKEIKQSRISKLRDKKCQLSNEQWEDILLTSLKNHRIDKSKASTVEKLETVATIVGDSIAIYFRNNISGITQKLGEIVLKQDESQEIDAISWCGTAVQRSATLEAEVEDLTAKYDEQSETLKKLNHQLEELIKAKETHDNSLLEKFKELLNNKKLKIRDQQRLLAGAKVDPIQAAKIDSARKTSKPRTPTASAVAKRKARDTASGPQSSEDESFEPKAQPHKEESEGSERADTPDASDQDATEDESDDDLDSGPRRDPLPDREKGAIDGNGKEDMEIDTPPPARELPFEKPGKDEEQEVEKTPETIDPSGLNQEVGNEDDETDDDDEL